MAYIPTKDSDLAVWADNFATLLTAAPATYGVDAATALLIQTENDSFQAAYALAVNPDTKTATTVSHKNGTKALFLADARNVAASIRANAGVSDADKIALGLNIPDPVPTPVPDPTTFPVLGVQQAATGVHVMVYADQLTPTKKAKPTGVIGCLLFRAIAVTPQTDFNAANPTLLMDMTKTPTIVTVPGGSAGKIATYWGQWFTRNGKVGPLSAPFSFACT